MTQPNAAAAREDALRTRSSLIRRAAAHEAAGWEEFYARYRPLVLAFALKCGLHHAEAEEAAQDVFVELARRLPEFDPDRRKGSFRNWLLGQTRWRVADKFRERRGPALASGRGAEDTGTDPAHRVPSEPEFEAIWEREWEEAVLREALQTVKARVSARDFQVFDLTQRQEVAPEVVARHLGLTREQVALIKHRVKTQVKAAAQRLAEEWET